MPQPPLTRRARTWLLWFTVAALLAWSWGPTEMRKIGSLFTDWRNMAEFASGFLRPDFGDWTAYAAEMVETVQIAIWGTALAVFFGIPFAILSSANVCPQWVVHGRQDVEQVVLGERAGGDVAGMRAATHQVGRAHHDLHAVPAGGSGRFQGGRELGDVEAERRQFLDVLDSLVVVAGHRQVAGAADGGERRRFCGAKVRDAFHPVADDLLDQVGIELHQFGMRLAVGVQVDELAGAGRVVHQRHEVHGMPVEKALKRSTTSSAQSRSAGAGDGRRAAGPGPARSRSPSMPSSSSSCEPRSASSPDAQQVEHGRDAGRRDLRIVGHDGRHVVGHDTFGPGFRWVSRWSVCSSISPATSRSPPRSMPRSGARPSPTSTIRSPANRHPALRDGFGERPTLAFAEYERVGHSRPSELETRDIDDAVADLLLDILVVEDADERRSGPLALPDEADHGGPVLPVERRGRLIEQKDRARRGKAAGDIDALLLAARERRRRQRPEPLGMFSRRSMLARVGTPRAASRPASRAAAATMSSARTRGMVRRNWLT